MTMIQLAVVFVCGIMVVAGISLRSYKGHNNENSGNKPKPHDQSTRVTDSKPAPKPQFLTVNHKPGERRQMRKAIRRACQTLSVSTKPKNVRERAYNFLRSLDEQWNGLLNDALSRVFKGGKEYSLEN